jgi:dihydroxyacetone kinase
MEMAVVTGSLMKSKHRERIKLLVGPASLCTSLDMNGFSLSLLGLTPTLESYLTARTSVAAWPDAVAPSFPAPVPMAAGPGSFDGVHASEDTAVKAMLEKVCATLIGAKKFLDDLDAKVGDADCGSTMHGAATSVLDVKDKFPFADPQATCRCLGNILSTAMGGSSGVLLSIMFTGMAASFQKSGKNSWSAGGAQAFMDGLKDMMEAGGASTGMRTMLDALVPAAEALVAGKGLLGAKAASEAGCAATKNMVPRAGRSENVPESAWKSCVDPGAKAAAMVFDALAA